MELKRHSERKEINTISEGWRVTFLQDVVTYISGKAQEKYTRDHGLFELVNSRFISTSGKIKKYVDLQKCPAEANDVLMVLSDVPNGKALAKAFFVTQNRRYSVNQRVALLRPNSRIEALYLYYSLDRNPYFLAFDDGAKQTNLSKMDFLSCPIVCPPLPEQKAIATALSNVDALIQKLEKLIAKKRDIKTAVMQQLLTGKTRLPGFVGDWLLKEFGRIVGIRKEPVSKLDIGKPNIELDHLSKMTGELLSKSVFEKKSASKTRFRSGDVLFGKLRSYLRKYWLSDLDGVCSSEIWPFVANPKWLVPEYLFYLVQQDDFIVASSVSYGTHMPRSDWAVLSEFKILLPSIREQNKIVEILSSLDMNLRSLEKKVEKVKSIRQGMMQELLTGKTRLV